MTRAGLLAVAASLNFAFLVDARMVVPNKEKEAIDFLFEKAHCEGASSEAVEGLKTIVSDEKKKRNDRVYALGKIRDLACEYRDSGLSDYLQEMQGTGDAREIGRLPEGYFFQEAAELSVCWLENKEAQVLRLEELLESEMNGYPALSVRSWAAEELCNRGRRSSLPKIENGLNEMSFSSREELLGPCRTKLHILSKSSSRLEALVVALQKPDDSMARELQFWAIDELAKLGSEEAYDALVAVSLKAAPSGALDPLLRERSLRLLRKQGATYEQLLELGASGFDLARSGFIPEKYRHQVPAKPDPCKTSSDTQDQPNPQ